MGKEQMLESVKGFLSRFKFGKYEQEILKAMSEVDRRDFAEGERKVYAYFDDVLPTEKGQTISQPRTVARMLQLLELKKGDNVLEVGAGSGWNAALISYLVGNNGEVLALEAINSLAVSAKNRIEKLGIENVVIENKDFRKLEDRFDKIIFTAGIYNEKEEKVIENYASEHLNNGGVLICPFREGPLIILKRKNGKIEKGYTVEQYVFVPLVL